MYRTKKATKKYRACFSLLHRLYFFCMNFFGAKIWSIIFLSLNLDENDKDKSSL